MTLVPFPYCQRYLTDTSCEKQRCDSGAEQIQIKCATIERIRHLIVHTDTPDRVRKRASIAKRRSMWLPLTIVTSRQNARGGVDREAVVWVDHCRNNHWPEATLGTKLVNSSTVRTFQPERFGAASDMHGPTLRLQFCLGRSVDGCIIFGSEENGLSRVGLGHLSIYQPILSPRGGHNSGQKQGSQIHFGRKDRSRFRELPRCVGFIGRREIETQGCAAGLPYCGLSGRAVTLRNDTGQDGPWRCGDQHLASTLRARLAGRGRGRRSLSRLVRGATRADRRARFRPPGRSSDLARRAASRPG